MIEKPGTLNLYSTTTVNTVTNLSFASRILAIIYWRLPHVGAAISKTLEAIDVEIIAPVLSFPAFPSLASSSQSTSAASVASRRLSPSSSSSSSSSLVSDVASTASSSSSSTASSGVTSSSKEHGPNRNSAPGVNASSLLYGWPDLYKELPPLDPNQQRDNGPWLTILEKFDFSFISFFKEWILHVKYVFLFVYLPLYRYLL